MEPQLGPGEETWCRSSGPGVLGTVVFLLPEPVPPSEYVEGLLLSSYVRTHLFEAFRQPCLHCFLEVPLIVALKRSVHVRVCVTLKHVNSLT